MADQVGLTASIITITGCICLTSQWLFTWGRFFYYDAENGVETLQDLINGTTVLLTEISGRASTSLHPRLDAKIVCARNAAAHLKHILHRILDAQNGSRFRWRLLWLRHYRNIRKLQLRLRNLKDEIMSMSHASVVKGTEETLLSITLDRRRDITMLQDTSSNLDRQLEALRTDIWLNNQLVSLEVQTAMTMLNFTPEIQPLEGISYQPTIPYRGFLSGSYPSHPTTRTVTSTNNFGLSSDRIGPGSKDEQATLSPCVQPASTFELSKTFKPQKYVRRHKLWNILATAFHQEGYSHSACINRYRVLYFQSEERWVNISISLEIPRTSSFWDLTQITQQQRAFTGQMDAFCLPPSLIKILWKYLENDRVNIKDHTHIDLRITDNNSCVANQVTTPRLNTGLSFASGFKIPAHVTECELSSWIRYTDCPRFSESEVFPWALSELPRTFVSYLGNKLVQEIKTVEQNPSPDFCYNLQLLHSLRGVPGVLELVGVTVDDSHQRIKSYLVEWPTTKCQLLLRRASSSIFPWTKIETWAKGLIRAMHVVHSRFFVVGTLRLRRPPILVDEFDNVYLHRFEHGININSMAAPFYPPEYRKYALLYKGIATRVDHPVVTPAYDLYQLGQILWILAESWATGQSALVVKEWFYKKPDVWLGGLYTGPDCLPLLSAKIPKYYQDIVDSCLAQNPHERLPCKDLLSMFPPAQNETEQEMNISAPEPMTVEVIQDCRCHANACDFCREQLTSLLYTCYICVNSDFDLCQKCFDKGKHCLDLSHLLVEVTVGADLPTKRKYYSSVNNLGKRNVIEDE